MAISSNRRQRELDKFVETAAGETAVRTTAEITGDVNVDNTSLSTDGYIGKPTGQNGDFVTAYTAATQITISSLPTGVSAFYDNDIVSIQQIDTTGAVVNTYTRDDAVMAIAANVITVTGATFGATDTFVVYTSVARPAGGADLDDDAFTAGTDQGQVVMGYYNAAGENVDDGDKGALAMSINRHALVQTDGYDSGTDSNKVFEVSPIPQHNVPDKRSATAQTDGTTTYYFDVRSYPKWSIQLMNTEGAAGDNTYTLEATVRDDGTAVATIDSDGDFLDVGTDYNAAGQWSVADGNLDAMIHEDSGVGYSYLKLEVVRANDGANNDGAWDIFFKKFYA